MSNKFYKYKNIPLFIFDIICLPIHVIRLVLIYIWGSKYNLKGFQFLDVIMHSDNPYFNQEDCSVINTIGKDYRVIIRDDSRLFPYDIAKYISVKRITKKNPIFLKNNKIKTESDSSNDLSSPEEEITKEIKGINYYESNDDDNNILKNKKNDILDSIRDELNSAFNEI